MHATIFSQEDPKDVLDSIFFVFERINSGGIRLSPQEIRNCVAAGPFTDLVKELNESPHWRNIFGGPENKRAKDEELIVRFLAMFDARGEYSRPMTKFLNDYSAKMNKQSPEKRAALKEIFLRTVRLVDAALNGRAFRPARSLNAAVLDSVMVGVATRLERPPEPDPAAVATAYDALIMRPEYRRAWERATADEESIKARMEAALDAFAAI